MATQAVQNGGISEDEAALYDRQIRLWGVEAQNRMRTSSVLLVTLRGVAAEITKNIVLAGIGNLTLLDSKDVQVEDLGANFFLREEDIGKKRVEAAAPKVQALNPRVEVKTVTDAAKLEDDEFLSSFDIIVITEVDAPTLLKINETTRRLSKKLFAASSVGLDGWIFADLLDHDYVVDKLKVAAAGEAPTKIPTKMSTSYVPFSKALEHKWTSTRPRAMAKIAPSLWGTLSLFAAQIASPSTPPTPESLTATAETYLPSISVPVSHLPSDMIARIAQTSTLEFPPSAAILGGIAGQDVLNALGGKEEPVRNLMVFDGSSGAGNVFQLGLA
ncbi:SUMO-activating enzyme subunit 1 [Pseudohyphozyma bogoriensis]|nr:SUMO-activating enzyme subunit 1 [Pseudohyphozyma bogoriensis]